MKLISDIPFAAIAILFTAVNFSSGRLSATGQNLQAETNTTARRIEQATDLKRGADEYIREANAFHKTAKDTIKEADNLAAEAIYLAQSLKSETSTTSSQQDSAPSAPILKGSAKFSDGIHPGTLPPLKLSTEEYKSALNQYTGDVSKFVEHSELYNAHLSNFDTQIGACHASQEAYAENLRKYEMHLSEFHLPDLRLPSVALKTGVIKPPHICPQMMLSEDGAKSMVNTYFNDQLRVFAAEQGLRTAEQQLQTARQGAGVANAKLETEIKRGKAERDLAIEFGKLREEYDLLKTERDRIASINKPAVQTAVQGTTIKRVQGKLQSRVKG